jgi:DNA gyrase inhibitor GyrI
MQTISEIADRIPDVFAWLGARGIEPVGAPFLRYHVIDMERELEIEAGVPVAATVDPARGVISGVLPAGRYAIVTHVGHPDELVDVTGRLLRWAEQKGLRWDVRDSGRGEVWGCRLESYLTDPAEVPDMHRWETELAFRLADG